MGTQRLDISRRKFSSIWFRFNLQTNFESKVFLKRAGKNQPSQKVSGSEGGTSIVFTDAAWR